MLTRETEAHEADYSSLNTGEELTRESAATSLPRQETEELLTSLQRHGRRRRKYSLASTILHWVVASNTVIGFGMAAYTLIRTGKIPGIQVDWTDWSGMAGRFTSSGGQEGVVFGGPWVIAVAVTIVCWRILKSLTRRQARMARMLPHVKDRRAVGPLLEALTLGDETLRSEAVEALVPLLRSLGPKDADFITIEHREILHAELAAGPPDLRDAVLVALEQVGIQMDAEALERRSAHEKDPDRRAAMEECAASIRRRAPLEKAKEQYLRPAESVGDNVLLRPASSALTAESGSLLRPSEESPGSAGPEATRP
jgi:hypothetical protein